MCEGSTPRYSGLRQAGRRPNAFPSGSSGAPISLCLNNHADVSSGVSLPHMFAEFRWDGGILAAIHADLHALGYR